MKTPQFISARVSKTENQLRTPGITLFNTSCIEYIRQNGLTSVIGMKYGSGAVEEVHTEETILYLKSQMFGLTTFMDRLLFLINGGCK